MGPWLGTNRERWLRQALGAGERLGSLRENELAVVGRPWCRLEQAIRAMLRTAPPAARLEAAPRRVTTSDRTCGLQSPPPTCTGDRRHPPFPLFFLGNGPMTGTAPAQGATGGSTNDLRLRGYVRRRLARCAGKNPPPGSSWSGGLRWGPQVRGGGGHRMESQAAQDGDTVVRSVDLQALDTAGGSALSAGSHQRPVDPATAPLRQCCPPSRRAKLTAPGWKKASQAACSPGGATGSNPSRTCSAVT
jgi:hypothetical protein